MSKTPSSLGIVALPFEVSTSFQKGTVHAPDTILNELAYMDTFDFALGKDPLMNVPRTVVKPHDHNLVDPRIQQSISRKVISELLGEGAFPISLGGEHTISLGPIQAARARGELGVVCLDAHGDLKDVYGNNPYNHLCVMRRVHEMDCEIMNVGTRSISRDEFGYANENNISIVSSKQVLADNSWYELLSNLPERIYLTVDMDFFDPSEAPSVGIPTPGGPSWFHVFSFLKRLFRTKNVIGADIVELRPGKNDAVTVRLAARLLSLIIGLRF